MPGIPIHARTDAGDLNPPEWWVKGSGQGAEASLFGRNADGSTGDMLEGCVENPGAG